MGLLLFNILLFSFLSGFGGRSGTPLAERLDLAPAVPVARAAEAAARQLPPVEPAAPKKIVLESLGVELKAPSAALIDAGSGEVLFSKGDDRIAPIASITKLMSALVILDAGPKWDQTVTMTKDDDVYPGLPYLKEGMTIKVRDLFNATLAGSLNNGMIALARSTGMTRDQFVAKMNSQAAKLGMTHTRFADPSGYLPGNLSSAFDVARLGSYAFQRQEIRDALTKKAIDLKTAQGPAINIPATDELLGGFLNAGDFQIVGGKTGFTDEAGYTLVAQARRGKGEVIVVVLGSPTTEDRFQDAKSLVAWGFRTFEW